MDAADACHALGIKTVAVTAGYIGVDARREFYAKMDAANVDLKAFTDDFYVKLCGAHLQPVLDTLVYLKRETDVWFEITTLLIPGKNDSDAELEAMCAWIVRELGTERAAAFHRIPSRLQDDRLQRTPAATLTRARAIALKAGMHYVYTGNVHDRTGGTTFCPGCGKPVIERDWHEILGYELTADGHCRHCDAQVPGRFGSFDGQWGRHRMPVRGRREQSEREPRAGIASLAPPTRVTTGLGR